MQICDFTPNDYPGLSALQNAIYPNRPRTPEGWAQIDKERHPKCKFRRWVAVEDGTIIGSGGYDQDITDYADQIQTEIRQATVTKRQELEAQLASLRQPKAAK